MPSKTKILNQMRPAMVIILDEFEPKRRILIKYRVLRTAKATILYLICSQIPPYKIYKASAGNPFYCLRVILTSNRVKFIELGISPIVTKLIIMQLLAGAKLIDVDYNVNEDKQLYIQLLLRKSLNMGNLIFIIIRLVFSAIYDYD
ncbi:unnamed protein product [Paramecium sonneborni]|uniref:Translocon Sec61/SecY plug domain-containing protein n=1 Tax=Paramecium sonneborni TaxID=65129 RepID=A0A8S1RHY2_9CILI|nr:unnamed protein product [Paramecium sonneborni]